MSTNDFSANSQSSLRAIGSAIRGALDQNELEERLRPHRALTLWTEIAGEKVASVCQAEAVHGAVLFVRAKSSVWANELTFYKPALLQKLNERLGGQIIEDIRFSTGNRASSSQKRPKSAQTSQPEMRDLSRIAPPMPPAAAVDLHAKLDALVARTHAVLAWKRANGWLECARCGALYEAAHQTDSQPKKPATRRRSPNMTACCPICKALAAR